MFPGRLVLACVLIVVTFSGSLENVHSLPAVEEGNLLEEQALLSENEEAVSNKEIKVAEVSSDPDLATEQEEAVQRSAEAHESLLGHRVDGDARTFLDKPRLLGVILGHGVISGMTVLNSELFVIRGRSTNVNVFSTIDFTFSRNITITGAPGIVAIVASARYNCLYITGNRYIFRYDLSNDAITEWYLGGYSKGVSLTRAHNLLVTVYNLNLLKEFTPDGRLIRDIYLHASITSPLISVRLSSDQIAVSYTGGVVQRICLVDMNRNMFQCHGGAQGPGVGQLSWPYGMAVDRYNNVMVSEYGNNRVALFSPTLTHLGYIAVPGYQMREPHEIHFDPIHNRLYISEHDDKSASIGRVFVLSPFDNHCTV